MNLKEKYGILLNYLKIEFENIQEYKNESIIRLINCKIIDNYDFEHNEYNCIEIDLKNKIINIIENNEIIDSKDITISFNDNNLSKKYDFNKYDFDYLQNYVSEDIKKIGYKGCNSNSQINIVDKTIAQEFLDEKEDLVEDWWCANYWFLNKKQIMHVSELVLLLNKIFNSELKGELILFRLDKKNYV